MVKNKDYTKSREFFQQINSLELQRKFPNEVRTAFLDYLKTIYFETGLISVGELDDIFMPALRASLNNDSALMSLYLKWMEWSGNNRQVIRFFRVIEFLKFLNTAHPRTIQLVHPRKLSGHELLYFLLEDCNAL